MTDNLNPCACLENECDYAQLSPGFKCRKLKTASTSNVLINAVVPLKVLGDLAQHIRNFDTTHPGCYFEFIAETTQSAEDVGKWMEDIDPPLQTRAIFRKQ